MNISSVIGAPATSGGSPSSNPSTQLGKEDFLRLLTVQLRHQDPLNPMDNTEFIAQMAQFSSLEQLQNMNQSLVANLDAEGQLHSAFQRDLATSLVGRQVEIPTGEFLTNGGDDTELGYRLNARGRAQIRITDVHGQLVREFDLDPSAVYGSVSWDGRNQAGDRAPAGSYSVQIVADGTTDQSVGEVLRRVKVDAVRYVGQEVLVSVDGRELALGDLTAVVAGQ